MKKYKKNIIELIRIINLYPAWAKIAILIFFILICSLLILVSRKSPLEKETLVTVEQPLKNKFQVDISITEFKKINDNICMAKFNIMNVGDLPSTIHDFYIAVGENSYGTKSVHRALNNKNEKLKPLVVTPENSQIIEVYFDINKSLLSIPNKNVEKLMLYVDIVVEAIAKDGLREELFFTNNSLTTQVIEIDKNYYHKLLYVILSPKTKTIHFHGVQATNGGK